MSKPKGGASQGRSFALLSPEERRALGSKGGQMTKERREQKRTMREAALFFLEQEIQPDSPEAAALLAKYPGMTAGDLVMFQQIKSALGGSLSAAEFVRDTSGQSPKQQVEVTQEKPFEVIIEVIPARRSD